MFGKHILLLVAHPDDEVVACAASIKRAQASGARISALYLTHGCLSIDTLWPWQRKYHEAFVARRRQEGEAVATFLGIQPVGWSQRPARHLWRALDEVAKEVEAAIHQFRPDQLWVPAYEGGNPDHDGLNAVGSTFKKRLSVLEFSEYNFFGHHIRSNSFVSSDETSRTITLLPDERKFKRAALNMYASERSNLSSLRCDQESYRPLASYDYAHPPHQGVLWYTRFQWVPFKHPRVDFTSPEAVSSALTSFLL
jgi:LmbE family N-acetylglucosaminyl deacetylase